MSSGISCSPLAALSFAWCAAEEYAQNPPWLSVLAIAPAFAGFRCLLGPFRLGRYFVAVSRVICRARTGYHASQLSTSPAVAVEIPPRPSVREGITTLDTCGTALRCGCVWMPGLRFGLCCLTHQKTIKRSSDAARAFGSSLQGLIHLELPKRDFFRVNLKLQTSPRFELTEIASDRLSASSRAAIKTRKNKGDFP